MYTSRESKNFMHGFFEKTTSPFVSSWASQSSSRAQPQQTTENTAKLLQSQTTITMVTTVLTVMYFCTQIMHHQII